MPQAATIKSLPQVFRMMKCMQAQDVDWGEDYRSAARAALKAVLEGRMVAGIDRHLVDTAGRGEADRRNGSYRRLLLTELGEIELAVPRTRRYSPLTVARAYARWAAAIVARARANARRRGWCLYVGLWLQAEVQYNAHLYPLYPSLRTPTKACVRFPSLRRLDPQLRAIGVGAPFACT